MSMGAAPSGETIPLVEHWDATLSYDVLEPDGQPREVAFVGRDNLKGALVSMISDPHSRGSVLVSGYRGAGKTTLVIESARLAKRRLANRVDDWELFPVSINVSEVAASMTTAIEDPAVGTSKPMSLRIHPNLLLTALLRELANRVDHVDRRESRLPDPPTADDSVAGRIAETYDKAVAATWSKEDQRSAASRHQRTSERSTSVAVSGVTKTLATLAVAALAAFGVGAAGLGVAEMIAAAAAAVLVVSFAWTVTSTRTNSKEQSTNVTARYDKSVHQLESDLKDILAGLHRLRLRTVVIIEELDKIDSEGDDLEAVIRYFKNLFTQAPALFFFITDKDYFDGVSAKIKQERRRRSYAIEHTFFTRRIYVGRPSADDCLDFIIAVMSDPGDQDRVRQLKQTDLARSRSLESMDRREQFIRYLLYQSDNHLFDLKNEMRRFVRSRDSGPVLEFDDVTFPRDEAAMAVFQFLAQRKVRSFWFGPGSSYASELLHDSLSAVFVDVDADGPQPIPDLSPPPDDVPADPAAEDQASDSDAGTHGDRAFAIAEQLTIAQRRRIESAISSLLGDLERGNAIVRSTADFSWEAPAATNFRPSPELEAHEEELVQNLEELRAALRPLTTGDMLAEQYPDLVDAADEQDRRLDERVREARAGEQVISANEAEGELVREEHAADALLESPYSAHAAQIGSAVRHKAVTRSLYLVESLHTDRLPLMDVVIFLAYGRPNQSETLARRIWSEVETRSPRSVGVVWVDPSARDSEVIGRPRIEGLTDERPSRLHAVDHIAAPGAVLVHPTATHEVVVPLGSPQTSSTGEGWIDAALDELICVTYRALGSAAWAELPGDGGPVELALRSTFDAGEPATEEFDNIGDALDFWWRELEEHRLYATDASMGESLVAAADTVPVPPVASNAGALVSGGGVLADRIHDLLRRRCLIALLKGRQLGSLPDETRAIVLGSAPDPDAFELRRVAPGAPAS